MLLIKRSNIEQVASYPTSTMKPSQISHQASHTSPLRQILRYSQNRETTHPIIERGNKWNLDFLYMDTCVYALSYPLFIFSFISESHRRNSCPIIP